MYTVDPRRLDLVEEYRKNPSGPYSTQLSLLVNRLRLGPKEERYIIVCKRRGREWVIAKFPTCRGAKLEILDGNTFHDYTAAALEVFKLRWEAATGVKLI